jgi:tetratricopeptide (TPR) repeat protein
VTRVSDALDRLAAIARECELPEILHILGHTIPPFPETETSSHNLNDFQVERYSATDIGCGDEFLEAYVLHLWNEAVTGNHRHVAARKGRAAFLLIASFLRADVAAKLALQIGTDFSARGLQKRAIEPLKFVIGLYNESIDIDFMAQAFFLLVKCYDKLNDGTPWMAEATEYLNFAQINGLKEEVVPAAIFAAKANLRNGTSDEAIELLDMALNQALLLDREGLIQHMSLDNLVFFVGDIFRQFSIGEAGIGTFQKFLGSLRRPRENELCAATLSEMGYTLLNLGDLRGINFLEDAIKIGSSNLDRMRRWQYSIDAFGMKRAKTQVPALPILGSIEETEYDLLTSVDRLIDDGRYGEAKTLALHLSTKFDDRHAKCSVLNSLAVCHIGLGEFDDALRVARAASEIADSSGDRRMRMLCRRTMALTYVRRNTPFFAAAALVDGLYYGEEILKGVKSLALRRTSVMEVNTLVELMAQIYQASHMFEKLLNFFEFARAPNLYRSVAQECLVESLATSPTTSKPLKDVLRTLRTIDVEMDIDLFRGEFSSGKHAALMDRRDHAQAEFKFLCRNAAIEEAVTASRIDPMLPQIAQQLLDDGVALLTVFQLDHETALVGAVKVRDQTTYFGHTLDVSREDLRRALHGVDGYSVSPGGGVAVRRGARFLTPARRTLEASGPTIAEVHERCIACFQRELDGLSINHLIVVPHDAFSLLPYWSLADAFSCSVTIAPSLGIAGLCRSRQRLMQGATLLVGDVTETLRYATAEISHLADYRKQGEVIQAQSVEAIIEAAPRCNFVSFACHGRYDTENPYNAGVIVERTGGEISGVGSTGNSLDSTYRKLTAGDCMTRLSLDACRLAILSACESGLPNLHESGEMTGLPSALLVAGAKSVIASLWPVDDAATFILMQHFMEQWAGGNGLHESPALALKFARDLLRTTTREEALALLGKDTVLPPGMTPFAGYIFTDAFHCFGSY